MTRDDVVAAILEFVVEESGVEANLFREDTDLVEAGILDSLLVLALVSFGEERFGCQFDMEELTEENFSTIDAVASLVMKKLANA